ncbi:hypothetical protein BgiMline_030842 [Biomphalaria glabrata]|nr:hypothetical protein BgiMline_019122 [Biomphalaria glabrata]
MMRWLKDKKREKKSVYAGEDGRDDDYGFDRERQASKSPPSKRQLPPTPAAPEEKSPHIYEEIPDLSLFSIPDNEKVLPQSKLGKGKAAAEKRAQPWKPSSSQASKYDSDISPYMVVNVDKEVRQTPTDFHRNGTPEVHCDVIVKDTHCEILMTRKPKVTALRLDSSAFAGGGADSNGGTSGVRNNTHFCSRDRRASVDVHSSGKMSAFSYSAFSSSSKNTSTGPQSSQSMSSFQELQNQEGPENDESTASGVSPYTCASNFIPRTKLTFHPLGGKDPRKEAFGSDCSDDSHTVNLARLREDAASSGTNGVSYSSIQEMCNPSKCVTYSSVVEQNTSGLACGKFDASCEKQSAYKYSDQHLSNESFPRAGFIRPPSPSNSSSCTYASVTFPAEPKIYNTIQDLDHSPDEITARAPDVVYSGVAGAFDGNLNNRNSTQLKCGFTRGLSQDSALNRPLNTEQELFPPHSVLVSDSRYRRSLDLDFCSCSDEHSSSCGCAESKNSNDDDVSSVAGTASDGPSSCKGCGRLIRQITYSESFSDETYEHVYASRLLIRNRRGNNSERSFMETPSLSEFPSASNTRSPDFMLAMSRDDYWALSRSDDTLPPAYGARDDNGFVSNYGESMSLKRRDSDTSSYRIFRDSKGLSVESASSHRSFMRQNTSPVASETSSMFCSLRATVSTSSIFSSRPARLSNTNDSLTKTHEITPSTENHDSATNNNFSEPTSCPKLSPSSEQVTFPKETFESNPKEYNIESLKVSAQSSCQIDSKPNALSGIFSKFTRAKTPKIPKYESIDISSPISPVYSQINDNEVRTVDVSVAKDDNADKNGKKLSKFFQRLSSKECLKSTGYNFQTSLRSEAEVDQQTKGTKVAVETGQSYSEDRVISLQKGIANHSSNGYNDALNAWGSEDCPVGGQLQKVVSQTKLSSTCSPEILNLAAIASDVQREVTRNACTSAFDAMSATKPQANTDSGDTCYEYDMSTSSEGEQASYDYFLSKVKKTLNLEREAKQVGDPSQTRKRLLCKNCKRDDQLASVETVEAGASGSSYFFCPHLSAKFGDLRAILADLVVDQRAAILDCLTDYAQAPFSFTPNAIDNHCRDCGFEVLASDSESLATIYTLLSHPLNYPAGHTPSCDSDEGTMADNSCESADEVIHGDKVSNSPKIVVADPEHQAPPRARKKDKKEKKSTPPLTETLSKEHLTDKLKLSEGLVHSKDTHPSHSHSCPSTSNDLLKNKHNTHSASTARKNGGKKSNTCVPLFTSDKQPSELPVDRVDPSKSCPLSKSKPGIMSDKAIQDIYCPLPSKALSLLTSRSYTHPAGTACVCGDRLYHASPTTMAAYLATRDSGKTLPPTADVDEKTMVPAPSCPRVYHANNGDEVPSVQSHLGHEVLSCNVEFPQHKREKDGSGERRKLSVNAENKIAVPGVKEPSMSSMNTTTQGNDARDGHLTIAIHGAALSALDKCAPSIINASPKKSFSPKRQSHSTRSGSPVSQDKEFYETAATRKSEAKHAIDKGMGKDGTASHGHEGNTVDSDLCMKMKLSRKHRLELAALDLLPETALCGDMDHEVAEVSAHEVKSRSLKPKRSKVVEKMAQLFEGQGHDLEGDARKQRARSNDEHTKVGNNEVQNTELVKSSLSIAKTLGGNEISSLGKSLNVSDSTRRRHRGSDENHLSRRSAKVHFNDKSSAVSDELKSEQLVVCEIERLEHCYAGNSRDNSTTRFDTFSEERTEARQTLSPPPSSSASTSSTSSLSKKKTGGKHRKLNKKSHKKRSRSRSERGKGRSSKGEKTLYYLSSDLSDIDVVEVEDWETYAKAMAPQHPKKHLPHEAPTTDTAVYNDVSSADSKVGLNSALVAEDGCCGFDHDCENEIYALPPSSSEIRGSRAHQQGSAGEQSPELPKARKGLRTDVYKTVRSNNKLLSDVIIRNYDMQVYGNV